MKESTVDMSAGNKANEFKVGDKVEYIGTSIYDDLKTGDVKIITDVWKGEHVDEIYGVSFNGMVAHVYPKELRLVEAAEDIQETFTVEQVIEAFAYIYEEDTYNNEYVIKMIKEELEKRKNPEYLKYLELKKKFGE